ncbi:hypothetical protein HY091_01750 [Candidatus Kaiserbacteria bacterium]|nr:hypothetical protein [Candidatus Kaiserbacteria bacterium]
MAESEQKVKRLLLLAAALLIAASFFMYRAIVAPRELRVFVPNVGAKGDSVVVETPSGKTLLIDAGPDASVLRALGSTLPEWRRRIDAVVLTSPIAMASGGLPEIFYRYHVDVLFRSGVRGSKSTEATLAAAAGAEPGLQQVELSRGARLTLGDGVIVDVLWPGADIGAMKPANSALVLRFSYGTTAFIIEENLSPGAAAWLATLDPGAVPSPTSLFISSSTPAGVYTSNGREILKK